jgi:hypothetical protein
MEKNKMKWNQMLKHFTGKRSFTKMVSLPNIDLAPEEAERFIDYIYDQSVLKNRARLVRMNKPTKDVRALGLGTGGFLYPGATFASSNYKKTLSQNKISLISKKVRGAIVIYDDDIEDNIEGPAFVDHVMRMVAKQIANELEDAFWIGDTNASGNNWGSDDIKSLWDGWRYRIVTGQSNGQTYYNDVSGGSSLLDATVDATFTYEGGKIAMVGNTAPYTWEFKYNKMISTMPSKYKTVGLRNFSFYHSDQVTQNYIEALEARNTQLGDKAILGDGPMVYGRVPIQDCPLMATTMDGAATEANEKATGGAYSDVLLTPNGNLILGIQRALRVEAQREPADEATYWFYTMRCDPAIENVNACVLLRKLVTAGSMVSAND